MGVECDLRGEEWRGQQNLIMLDRPTLGELKTLQAQGQQQKQASIALSSCQHKALHAKHILSSPHIPELSNLLKVLRQSVRLHAACTHTHTSS